MRAAADVKERYWFSRVANDLVNHPGFCRMPGNYAKVYLYIALRQNYVTRKTFASVRKIAERCGVAPGTVISALRLLEEWGAVKIEHFAHRASTIEIIKHFCELAPVERSNARERSCKTRPRTKSGRFIPTPRNDSVPTTRNAERSNAAEHLQKSPSQKSHYENPPPPPRGGNGRPDEVGRPRYTLSEKTIRDLIAAKGKTEIIEMLRQGNYPIPAFLLTDTKDDLADIPNEALE